MGIQIRTLSDYVEKNCKMHEDESSTSAFFEKATVYRGLSREEYDICPSISRLPDGNWLNSYLFVEEDFWLI